jgi:S1-C subfamily serine protease
MLEDTENEDGVLVTATSKMGHAKKAGIEKDDVILAIDSEPVNDIEDVKIAMLYKEDSETVTVKILRQKFLGKNIIDIEVNLKNRPSPHN